MWEDNRGEDHAVSHENWNCLEWESSKRVLTTNCIQLESISLSRGLPSTPTVGTVIRHPRFDYLMSYSIWLTGVIQNWMFQDVRHVTFVTGVLVKILWSAIAWFLRLFVTLWKATISFVEPVSPSARMEQLRSLWTDFHEIHIGKFYLENLYWN